MLRPIFVAGRTGQLARALMVRGEKIKLPLVAVGRPELDLTQAASIERILVDQQPRAIVNAAAYTLVDKAESETDEAFMINRDGAGRLARAAERLRVPFIHVSSDYVFDGAKQTPYQEDDPPSPLGVYGRSKRDGEVAVLSAYPAAIVVRTSWVYSAYGQNFVKTMLRLGESRDHIKVVNDQFGAPTSANDLAQAIIEMIEQLEKRPTESFGGIYHLTANGVTSWYGFASAIFAGWNRRGWHVPSLEPISTAEYPTPARRPSNSRLDCSKTERVFGVRLPPWREALESCLDELAIGQAGA